MRYKALVTSAAHVGWPSSTAERKRYLVDHGYTLLEFFPAGGGEMQTKDIKDGTDMDVLLWKLTSLRVVQLKKLIWHILSRRSRKG